MLSELFFAERDVYCMKEEIVRIPALYTFSIAPAINNLFFSIEELLAELSLGFTFIGVENSFLVAAVIAFLDLLPVIGTGGVIIPWIIIELLLDDFNFALKLFSLYLIVTVIRNIIEPKTIGNQLGLHPLIMLMCMYVGIRAFGIVGMFVVPVAAVLLKQLYDSGNIHFITDIRKNFFR